MAELDLNTNNLLEAAFESMMQDLNLQAARLGLSLVQMKWNKEAKKVEFQILPFEDIFKSESKPTKHETQHRNYYRYSPAPVRRKTQ